MILPCGTFRYTGVVPIEPLDAVPVTWTLVDEEAAAETPPYSREGNNRLAGVRPTARLDGRHLVLQARTNDRAEMREVSVEFDPELLGSLRSGDRLELVRTFGAGLAAAVFRGDELCWAVGALTHLRLCNEVSVAVGPWGEDRGDPFTRHPPAWIDVTVPAGTMRLREGEERTIGRFRVVVARNVTDGDPGQCENLAIINDACVAHDAVLKTMAVFGRWNGGLTFTPWQILQDGRPLPPAGPDGWPVR